MDALYWTIQPKSSYYVRHVCVCVCVRVCVCVCVVCVCVYKDAELESQQNLTEVPIDDILEAQRQQQENKQQEKKKRETILRARGINPLEHGEETFHD